MTLAAEVADGLAHAFGCFHAGCWTEAEAWCRQVLGRRPDHAGTLHLLGLIAHRGGRTEEALDLLRRAVAAASRIADFHNNLGIVLGDLGQADEALAAFDEAIRLRPDFAEAFRNRGVALARAGRLEEAADAYRQVVRLRPGDGEIWQNLAAALHETGRVEEAAACQRERVAAFPGDAAAHSELLVTLHYLPAMTPRRLLAEAREWARRHAGQAEANVEQAEANVEHPTSNVQRRSSRQQLRVGYVTSNPTAHPEGRFLRTLLVALDRRRIDPFVYGDAETPDKISEELAALAGGWRDLRGVPDDEAAELIRRDRIDLLVDLTGHFARNRMRLFARKPAPVQVAHFGYPGTSGLGAMNFRITDVHADPPGTGEGDQCYTTERLWRLPHCAWCYDPPPPDEAPDPGPPPATRNGYVTFGSVNRPLKVTPEVAAVWAEILRRVRGSRLILLLGMRCRSSAHITRLFTRHGIDPGRVEFVERMPRRNYFRLIAERIDVALDPFPYNGGVTTGDLLWMGVPVVALAGDAYWSRQGEMLLKNVGLGELVAATPEHYVQTAADLASNLPELARLRRGLRAAMAASPLCDVRGLARALERAYQAMVAS